MLLDRVSFRPNHFHIVFVAEGVVSLFISLQVILELVKFTLVLSLGFLFLLFSGRVRFRELRAEWTLFNEIRARKLVSLGTSRTVWIESWVSSQTAVMVISL